MICRHLAWQRQFPVTVNIMNNWPCYVTKTRHLASRQNRPHLCLHFRIIKWASDWPKRTHVGHFLRLRQAGPQNASNCIFTRKQRNLLDNSPYSKEAQSRNRQASTPNANKRWTDSTYRQAAPTRGGKRETDKAHVRFSMTYHLHLKNLPLKNFSGGGRGRGKFVTMNYCPKIPRMSISTALWKHSLTNAITMLQRMCLTC